jgi:hypothetical protein
MGMENDRPQDMDYTLFHEIVESGFGPRCGKPARFAMPLPDHLGKPWWVCADHYDYLVKIGMWNFYLENGTLIGDQTRASTPNWTLTTPIPLLKFH